MNAERGGTVRAAIGWVCATRWRQALLLIAVCAAVFLPRLGATGFSMSEGHRVVPAWEMLDDARGGDPHWLVPRMFGTAYLRKPPGMMWAIAASSVVFGETEFAARLPSALAATLLAVAVWWLGTRWFGSPWGLAAGLAQALLPVTWPSARSAEIESLHMLTTGLAALVLIDWLARPPGARLGHWLRAGAVGISLLATLLVKGPSGAPFVGGALLGTLVALGARPARGALLPLLVALGIAAVLGQMLTHPRLGGVPAVTQGVGDFLWERDKLLRIIFISPTILATMLPVSLALVFPWGPDAKRERDAEGIGAGTIARALAFASLGSLAFFEAAGVSNARYGLPLCALLAPLAAYVASGAWERGQQGALPAFLGKRPRIARAMLLGSPFAWPAILLVAAAVYVGVLEPHRRGSSGREAGIALAAHLPDRAEVWADEMIEARPEVLLYAVREAEREGRRVRVRWLKPEFMPTERPEGLLVLLREDTLVDEVARYRAEGRFGTLAEVAWGEVHKYRFVLCRVADSRGE